MLPYKINKELLLQDKDFLKYQNEQFARIIKDSCVEIKNNSYIVGGFKTVKKVSIHNKNELNNLIYFYGNKAIQEIKRTKQKLEQYELFLKGKQVDEVTALYYAFNKGWINASNNTNIFIPPL